MKILSRKLKNVKVQARAKANKAVSCCKISCCK